ncbi:hypothetical protein MTBBW1_1200004 [Desulfamplus magnetovallimortis]|uniref:Uncharacterized protein n=1 Tax=Desulfamplus magnetovallimortis TaxID=1246637 RepID=A0A1W1H624_9BACT|nr:hypothetical protein MTBBW1_1200004 [Desulfamplus magnetovallimortis]
MLCYRHLNSNLNSKPRETKTRINVIISAYYTPLIHYNQHLFYLKSVSQTARGD